MSNPSNNPEEQWIVSELVQEDPDFADLVEEFVASLDGRLRDLQGALAQQDFDQLRGLAHQLKGAGGGHGYPILTEKAAVLEQQAIAKDIADIQAGIEELSCLVARVIVARPK